MTKTKQMLREKYWFPEMNKMSERVVENCYECQLTTKQHRQEPVKMTQIPEKPWEVVSVDFGGPYPDGHYNLVVIDKRTRYPEVEVVYSTGIKPTKEKLKKIFATHGTPIQIESDNGPPFQSKEFAEFAAVEGFRHHRITPLHPRANGEAKSFMKLVNKTEQRAQIQKYSPMMAIQEMLIGYRSTPHPATGITPYEGMMNRIVRTKLDYENRISNTSNKEKLINERDRQYKEKVKQNAENKNTKEHTFDVGDHVLLEQPKKNKWSTEYEPDIYIIYKIKGSTVYARSKRDGREISRDSSKFRIANKLEKHQNEGKDPAMEQQERREVVLRKSKKPIERRDNNSADQVTGQQEEYQDDNDSTGTREEMDEGDIPPTQNDDAEHVEEQQLRRSDRTRQRSKRLNDYLTSYHT